MNATIKAGAANLGSAKKRDERTAFTRATPSDRLVLFRFYFTLGQSFPGALDFGFVNFVYKCQNQRL